jgi:hypothetical protein
MALNINWDDPWIQQKAQQQFGGSIDDTFSTGRQGALTWALLGELGVQPDTMQQIEAELQKQAQIAGLPEDFDWTPHLVAASQQHWQQYNQPFRRLETPVAGIIAPALQNAAQTVPELAGAGDLYAFGSDYWNQSVAEQQARWGAHKSAEGGVQSTFWGGLAALAGGAALSGGGAAGAGAGTEAAATYGAAGEFAGAGAGAAGAGTAGATLAEQSAAIGGGSAAGTAAGTGVGTGTAVTGAGTVGTAATGTALQRILDGSATTQDYLTLTGQVAPSLLGMYASGQQTDALTGLANQYMEMGAPYRSRLAEISADPNQFYESPQAQQATESVLRRLSATHGNVAGSPYAQALTTDALFGQYGQERDRLAGYGGLTQYNAAAPGAATAAIGSQANFYNALGGGIADVTTPRTQPRTLAEILRAGGYA